MNVQYFIYVICTQTVLVQVIRFDAMLFAKISLGLLVIRGYDVQHTINNQLQRRGGGHGVARDAKKLRRDGDAASRFQSGALPGNTPYPQHPKKGEYGHPKACP